MKEFLSISLLFAVSQLAASSGPDDWKKERLLRELSSSENILFGKYYSDTENSSVITYSENGKERKREFRSIIILIQNPLIIWEENGMKFEYPDLDAPIKLDHDSEDFGVEVYVATDLYERMKKVRFFSLNNIGFSLPCAEELHVLDRHKEVFLEEYKISNQSE